MITPGNAEYPVYYCADCVAEWAVRDLEKAAGRVTPPSRSVLIGSILIAIGVALAGYGILEAVRGTNGVWCIFVLAFIPSIYGLDQILRRKQIAAASAEKAASARRTRDSIDARHMTTAEKLALFGVVPGEPFAGPSVDAAILNSDQ